MSDKSLCDGWNSIPNIITYVRIVMVAVFVWLTYAGGPYGINDINARLTGAILFILAASTDKLDGYLARKYNQVTELGKLMDPIADKILIISALVVLSIHSELSWWITALFVAREVIITVMRFVIIDKGGKVIAASAAGKLKTVAQSVGLGLMLLPVWIWIPQGLYSNAWGVYYWFGFAVVVLALVFCLYSGGEYLLNTVGGASCLGVEACDKSSSQGLDEQ